MKMFTVFPGVYVILHCFKQLPVNLTLALVPYKLNAVVRLLSDVVEGGVIFSLDNPLDFHDEI